MDLATDLEKEKAFDKLELEYTASGLPEELSESEAEVSVVYPEIGNRDPMYLFA